MRKFLVLLAAYTTVAVAAPRFSNVFQSHMVIQRNKPLTIWGFGAASMSTSSATLTVALGDSLKSSASISGDRWQATFAAQPASTNAAIGLTVTLSSAGTVIQTLEDVLIGDVFLFSGQVSGLQRRIQFILHVSAPSVPH